jgi:hypothetical protein
LDKYLLRVMTFKVRGSSHRDRGNVRNNRAQLNVQKIKHHKPHLIGFQELQDGNLETCKRKLPEYSCVLRLRAGNKAHTNSTRYFRSNTT